MGASLPFPNVQAFITSKRPRGAVVLDPRETSTSKRGDYVFIVNPNGRNGRAKEEWQSLAPKLKARFGSSHIFERLTLGPHGDHPPGSCGRDRCRRGRLKWIFIAIEVVNGFLKEGHPTRRRDGEFSLPSSTALRLIPVGTGSDFQRVFGRSNDLEAAIDRLHRGTRQKIDVGKVVYGPEPRERFFINVADVHLSARAAFWADKHKQLGRLCYVVGSLKGFKGFRNRDFRIRIDDGSWETWAGVTAICVGNSKFFGGGMKIAPGADPSSGDLEVIILRGYKWYDFITKLHMLYMGTHVRMVNKVATIKVRSIDVAELEGLGDLRPGGRRASWISQRFFLCGSRGHRFHCVNRERKID